MVRRFQLACIGGFLVLLAVAGCEEPPTVASSVEDPEVEAVGLGSTKDIDFEFTLEEGLGCLGEDVTFRSRLVLFLREQDPSGRLWASGFNGVGLSTGTRYRATGHQSRSRTEVAREDLASVSVTIDNALTLSKNGPHAFLSLGLRTTVDASGGLVAEVEPGSIRCHELVEVTRAAWEKMASKTPDSRFQGIYSIRDGRRRLYVPKQVVAPGE